MKQFNTQVFALALGVQAVFAGAALAQQAPPADGGAALAATLSSAFSGVQTQRNATSTLMTPDQVQETQDAYAALSTGASTNATVAGVDAASVSDRSIAQDAVARVDTATTYEQLRATGKANEKAAYKRKREASRYDPPMQDEKGYYFDIVQTWNYRHVPRTDEAGLQAPEYYAAMRCRAAPRKIGPLADNPNWKKAIFWRVCPDESGRYRPTM